MTARRAACGGRLAPALLLLLAGCAATNGASGRSGDDDDMSLVVRILIGIGFAAGVMGIGWFNRENR